MSDSHRHDYLLDTSGLSCPDPLLRLRNRVRTMTSGEVLLVKATDPTTERDFRHFCHFLGHRLLASCCRDGCYHYWIARK